MYETAGENKSPAGARRTASTAIFGSQPEGHSDLRLVKSLRQAAHMLRNSKYRATIGKAGNPNEITMGYYYIDRGIAVDP
jgi:hypothetical protein